MTALDVLWLPSELAVNPVRGRTTVVVDVIRATTSIATALHAGALRVIPAPTVDAAREAAKRIVGALLCGERTGLPPEGFDLGNSPASYEPGVVGGRWLVFTTTNGTAAVHAVRESAALYLACFRNAGAAARALAPDLAAGGRGAVILCAGRQGRISMDDAWCAGHLVQRVLAGADGLVLGEGARAARALAAGLGPVTQSGLAQTAAGRATRAIGLADDLAACATVDDLEVVPTWRDGAFVKGGEEDV